MPSENHTGGCGFFVSGKMPGREVSPPRKRLGQILVMSMGVRSSLRLCSRTVRTARAVSMAVTQATECSTAERRILKPSLSCLRPLVGGVDNQVHGAALDHIQDIGVGLRHPVHRLQAMPAAVRASQVPEVA